ncbi:unnamed protein product [Blepharisma stoltei]|uniref:Uncharacterized protein n=1 Tax=Blepharisma stoltei TaxID=1481888 RepID=A0AAU9K9Z1_9CILI|nr:unnamed protein product [Blepharisma stoltei]
MKNFYCLGPAVNIYWLPNLFRQFNFWYTFSYDLYDLRLEYWMLILLNNEKVTILECCMQAKQYRNQ